MSQDQSYLQLISESEQKRFWSKVDKTDGCWFWKAATLQNGYGVFNLRGTIAYAHRIAYLAAKGTISETLVVDHICRTRNCVNPNHMREITRGENVSIGRNALREKTHCVNGHPFSGHNMCRVGRRQYRACRICHQRRNEEYRRRLRQRELSA